MPQRRRYTKQFKEEALRLVSQEGASLTQVARDLGINAGMLRSWQDDRETRGPNAFPGCGYAHDEEIAKLQRELGRVKRERDFLKDAAYFAKESKRGFGAQPATAQHTPSA